MVNDIRLLGVGHTLETYQAFCSPPPTKTCYDWLGGLIGCQEKPLRYKYPSFVNRNIGTDNDPDYWLEVPGINKTGVYVTLKKQSDSFWIRCKCKIFTERSFCNIDQGNIEKWDILSVRDDNKNTILRIEITAENGLGFDNDILDIKLIVGYKEESIPFPHNTDFIFDLRVESGNVQLFIDGNYIALTKNYMFNRKAKYVFIGDDKRHVWNKIQVKWLICSELKAENCYVKTIWPEDTGDLKDWTWDESDETPAFMDLRENSWIIRGSDYMGAFDSAAQTFSFVPSLNGNIVGTQLNGIFFGLVNTTTVYYIKSQGETIFDLSEGFTGKFGDTYKLISYPTDKPLEFKVGENYGVIMELEE